MSLSETLFLALVALLLGLWLGRKTLTTRFERRRESTSYMQGLTFLLDDEPDKAVEEFVRALEVNPDTLETHLALGKLMRKQGHVNRAIRIHQNVLARPSLDPKQQHQIHLELARDFMAAGLLDRAELLLKEVISESAELRSRAQRYLIEIYQDESEWLQAIEVANSLLQSKFIKSQADEKKYVQRMVSHFYCELAQSATAAQDIEAARKYLSLAAATDKTGVRVAVLTATKFNLEGNFRQAIKVLGKLGSGSSAWFAACLPTLLESFNGLYPEQGKAKLWAYLKENAVAGKPSASEAIFLVDQLLKAQPANSENLHLAKHILRASLDQPSFELPNTEHFIAEQPSAERSASARGEKEGMKLHGGERLVGSDLALLNKLAALELSAAPSDAMTLFSKLVTELELQLQAGKLYRCDNCGFSGQQLNWRCPSCKRWDSCQRIDETTR